MTTLSRSLLALATCCRNLLGLRFDLGGLTLSDHEIHQQLSFGRD